MRADIVHNLRGVRTCEGVIVAHAICLASLSPCAGNVADVFDLLRVLDMCNCSGVLRLRGLEPRIRWCANAEGTSKMVCEADNVVDDIQW